MEDAMRTRRAIACIAGAALAGSLALALPQVAGAASGHGGARHRQKHHKIRSVVECVEQRPTVVMTPTGGDTYQVVVTNMDSAACGATTFLIQGWYSSSPGHSGGYEILPFNYEWRTLKPGESATLSATGGGDAGGVGAIDWGRPQHSGTAS
jgi:hypothetical protein